MIRRDSATPSWSIWAARSPNEFFNGRLEPLTMRVPRKMTVVLIGVAALAVVSVLGLLIVNLMSKPPAGLGIRDGRLAPCPKSPNCVCSLDTDAQHKIEPLQCSLAASVALDELESVLGQMERAHVVRRTDDYLHAEFRTKLLRFVDDVEFHVIPDEAVIHVRSASRIGYSDLGVNRARVDRIRELWNARRSP